MTRRDPRLPASDPALQAEASQPDLLGKGRVRDPTQSLSIDPVDSEVTDGPLPLALGTHEAEPSTDRATKLETPGARGRTQAPVRAVTATRPPPIPRATDDPEHRLGSVLGSYRVEELLGKGGMGYVYRAEHIRLGREVALKLLRSDYARRRDSVARFFQEARTVNRVRHRNIVDVTDFVELSDGTTFIIMELLRGQSLGAWARPGVGLSRVLAVLVQICDGLGAAHQVGVVHRDLKPDNVIVVASADGDELVKLLDFGVAKLLNRDDEDVGFETAAGSVIGTPAYMSPEQAGGMAIDARSDIYSLGAIMYELFCGHPMFRGRSFGEYVRKHLTEMAVPPRQTEAGAHLDPRLEAVILKALEKDPDQRYRDVREMREALDELSHQLEGDPSGPARRRSTSFPASVAPSVQTATVIPKPSERWARSNAGGGAQIQDKPSERWARSNAGGGAQIEGQAQAESSVAEHEVVTPWWAWLVGGSVAIGVGMLATIWVVGSGERGGTSSQAPARPPDRPAVSAPTANVHPIVSPPPRHVVNIRFDSLPSAGVYAEGRAAELCSTPCELDIDLEDGDLTERRAFILRTEGYLDARVLVDLAATQREFHVTLAAMPAMLDKTSRPAPRPAPRAPTSPPSSPASSPGDPGPPMIEGNTPDQPTSSPAPPAAPKKPTIEATDTLDPFHRKQ